MDAVTFYRLNLVAPLSRLAALLGIALPAAFFDWLFVGALAFGATIRVAVHRRSLLDKVRFRFGVALAAGALLLFLSAGASFKTPVGTWFAWTAYVNLLIWMYLVSSGASRLLAMVWMLFPPVVVGLLAAISAGLVRT